MVERTGTSSGSDLGKVVSDYDMSQSITRSINKLKQDPRSEVAGDAKKSLRKPALDYANAHGFDVPNEDALTDEEILGYGENASTVYDFDSANRLYNNFDSIVDTQIAEGKLERLAKTKEIQDAASDDDTAVLRTHANYLAMKDFADRYRKDGESAVNDNNEVKLLNSVKEQAQMLALEDLRKKAIEKETERQKAEGYTVEDDRLKALAGKLAEVAYKRKGGDVSSYVQKALDESVAEAKKNYEDLDKDVVGVVRNTLKSLAGEGSDTEDFVKARALIYAAEKDKIK